MSTPAPDLAKEAKVLEHIQVSHLAIEKTAAELEKTAAQLAAVKAAQAKAAELIPQVVEALVRHSRVDPAVREKLAAALADPAQAMGILLQTADPANLFGHRPLGTLTGGEPTVKKSAVIDAVRPMDDDERGRRFKTNILGLRS